MRMATLSPLVLVVALCGPTTSSSKNKPLKTTTVLSADEVTVYKAVLQQYGSKEAGNMHVSNTTYPLNPSENCSNIQLENLGTASRLFHDLPPEILAGDGMVLVDPQKQAKIVHSNDPSDTIRKGKSVKNAVTDAFGASLFSMSEIAFDKDRHFAVVSYRFWCGSLCGNGSTIVFEKINGVWEKNRNCGGWIS